MSQVPAAPSTEALTGLLLSLTDRTLLLPNVAVAELVPYRPVPKLSGMPDWCLGQVGWRDLRLPLLSFEAASGATLQFDRSSTTARVAIINALGGREHVRFLALLVQGIPRSMRVTPELQAADVPLAPLELAAVQHEESIVKIPDLVALEEMLGTLGIL
ncbi:chemosensory pili system protein ChpC [Pseudomonas duriflava]|uniref:Chemosensory pili system protein ChpC n=1 Tax=Pseudomonas duriflava TaxID=459528 RepID=A0A562QNV5_9PSED|nr:chemotaxis protein CheW [Pseudomonas duriflava]TWI58414.1 chemosensory pili system protein ChpC [Pseudomonas duriflava]